MGTEFPITWDDGEAARFWFWDQSHWPHPTVPLAATLELPAMAEGFTRAARALKRPFPAWYVKVVNGFVYFGFDLVSNPAGRAAAAAAHAAVLAGRIPDVTRFWTEDVLPEVQAANDHMRSTDWDRLPDTALAAAVEELYRLRARQWELHDLVLVPAMAAMDAFLSLYARRFPEAPAAAAHALLRGLPNKTVETARALWRLARDEEVARFVADLPPHPLPQGRGNAHPSPNSPFPFGEGGRLMGRSPGRSGLGLPPALQAYLDEYGWRTDGWELSDPSLCEEPSPLLARLRRYAEARHPDPERELARAAEERERLTAAALARLPDEAARAEFVASLAAARAYPVLSEDHNFYIDQMGLTVLRVPLLAMGRRLVTREMLERPNDVFYLSREELVEVLAGPHPPAPSPARGRGGERRETASLPSPSIGADAERPGVGGGGLPVPGMEAMSRVAERRAERARWWGVRPPATIGAPLPPEMADDPLYAGFFGIGTEPPAGGRVVRGVGAVPGVAAGPARVARTLVEADKLAPGDILVCPMTSPAWTPLFATAAAVVADAGGILSHTAIVAREFGIPCVVATRIACDEITDGEWIEVDGTTGVVRRGVR